MNTFNKQYRMLRLLGGAYLMSGFALAALAAKDAEPTLSFERKEGFKPGVQKSSEVLTATDGSFSVVEGKAPAGDAFLQFDGESQDSLGLIALPKRANQSLNELRFALRAPFTDVAEDRDYFVAGGAIVGIAQTEHDLLVSFPVDRQGNNWRELRVARDASLSTLPVDWAQFEVRRDVDGKRWDLTLNRRVLASGLPLASGLEEDDVFAISGLGPVSIDDLQLTLGDFVGPFPTNHASERAQARAIELRAKHQQGDRAIAADAKGRRGPAWGRAADPGATSVGTAPAPLTPAHLELFLPKP